MSTISFSQQAPLYTCKAYIFQVDPDTRKSWLQLSTNAVNVQIFHDSVKNVYRILSVDDSKVLINTIVTSRMNFTKTSQKFCQWVDSKANHIYGLGFANENDLTRFINKFTTVKEATKKTLRISRSETDWPIQSKELEQLKQENAQLKLALTQSSNNANKWQEELEILRNNNAKLTTALQESHANVEEWKRQLHFYRDECCRLRDMVFNRHAPVDATKELKNQLDNADLNHQDQDRKILQLENQVQRYITQISSLTDRLTKSGMINQDLRNQLQKHTVQKPISRSPYRNLQQLIRLRDVFETKTKDFNQTLTVRSQELQQLCSQITDTITEF